MSRREKSLLATALVWAVLGPGRAGAEDLQEERTSVRERLSAQRAALTALREQKLGVLEALEFIERLARTSSAKAHQLDAELRTMRGRIDLVRGERDAARTELSEQLRRIGPRLFVLYRLLRDHPLRALLSATDFSSMIWRSRAMSALVSRDLDAIQEAKRIADFAQRRSLELEGLEQNLAHGREAALEQAREASARQTELSQVVAALHADAVQSKRIIGELEAEDRALTKLIKGLQMARSTGFRALKGRLLLPVEGVLEVGFGKVVNPKFNTVTVQKGWDIRAAQGSPVRAIAPGQVVYAGWLRGYGNVLIIDHGGGFHTLVAHLESASRAVGESVQAEEPVGAVGDTGSLKGPYLYFEIRQDGEAIDPAGWVRDGAAEGRRARGRP